MRIMTILVLVFGSFTLQAQERLPEIWKSAYLGDYPCFHRDLLSRKARTGEELIFQQMTIAYFHYRTGNKKELVKVLKIIDQFIEDEINSRNFP